MTTLDTILSGFTKEIGMGLLATGKTILEILIAAITFIALLHKVWFKKWYTAYKAKRNEWYVEVREALLKLDKKLNSIDKQVNPNGGSSLSDGIVRIETRLNLVDATIGGIVLSQRNGREISGIASWESDANGAVTYVAPSLCEMYGVSPEYIMNYSWVGLVIQRDRERCIKAWKQSIEYGSSYDIEVTLQRGDHTYIDIHATAIHTKKDGKVVSSLGRVIAGNPYKDLK